ncbi:MAG: group II intron maturase-specific domain-containing protein [Solirubrobacterales bacterium]
MRLQTRIRKRLPAEMVALRGANAAAVLRALNPIVRGWSAYYCSVVSTETFQSLDHYVWRLTYKWAVFRHPGKSKHWIVNRYFGQLHPTRPMGVRQPATAAPTSCGSPGRRSSGATWSRAQRPRTTLPLPSTGPNGGSARQPNRRSAGPTCVC